ncbi:MAG TPA: c-type cytochrome [Terriglobia bacterium]|nr:c-type cytochrome [Terriglobia bacterium]
MLSVVFFLLLLRQGAGPADKQVVDAAAADRGKTIYTAECITCHGARARGTEDGADLVRSVVVLRDRFGSEIGPFLRKGHPTQSNKPSASFTQAQTADLSHFLKQRVNDTLRSSPSYQVQNVLTGDAKAGAAYFNGAGKCNTCHSPSGDLAGIGKRLDPPTLQQRVLFPRRTKPVTVTVTPPSGPAVSGTLERIDDFDVSLRDAAGQYRSWQRVPGLKVEKHDPLALHNELLDQYTDKDMHDIVRYLETLK